MDNFEGDDCINNGCSRFSSSHSVLGSQWKPRCKLVSNLPTIWWFLPKGQWSCRGRLCHGGNLHHPGGSICFSSSKTLRIVLSKKKKSIRYCLQRFHWLVSIFHNWSKWWKGLVISSMHIGNKKLVSLDFIVDVMSRCGSHNR